AGPYLYPLSLHYALPILHLFRKSRLQKRLKHSQVRKAFLLNQELVNLLQAFIRKKRMEPFHKEQKKLQYKQKTTKKIHNLLSIKRKLTLSPCQMIKKHG